MWSSDEELEGFDYIRFSGSISTCDLDLEFDVPERQFGFGFRSPERRYVEVVAPELSSEAWGEWLL